MPRFATKDDLKSIAQSAKSAYAASTHTHTQVNGHSVLSDVPANAVFTDTTYPAMTSAELEAGTSTAQRTVSPKLLADAIGSGGSSAVLMTQAEYDALQSPESAVLYCTYPPAS
jgi:hypothetical protein